MNLTGKNILISGGGGYGVGGGICKALHQYGARLIINEKCEERIDAVLKTYPNAIPVIADVSKYAEVETMFHRLEKEVGIIHGLVNNAGVGLSQFAYEASETEFDDVYKVDIKGVWMMSKFFVKQLLKHQSGGNIVNISSVHAHSTMLRYAVYGSAKSAVEGLTRGMAVELGKYDIRVNAIAPGYVHAEQNYDLIRTWTSEAEQWVQDYIQKGQAIPRAVQPEDCGYAVVFLLSDLGKSITGQTLCVDNGDTIRLSGV